MESYLAQAQTSPDGIPPPQISDSTRPMIDPRLVRSLLIPPLASYISSGGESIADMQEADEEDSGSSAKEEDKSEEPDTEQDSDCQIMMLPTTSRSRSSSSSSRANPMFLQYFRRIVKWQQMDVEYTFWQMLNLCTSPKVVYQHTKYHKQTKNQWARDDPAFIVICSLLLVVATLAYCATYDHSSYHAIVVVVSVFLSHFLITGAVIATCCWFLTNSYLREEAPNSHVVEQRVEWLYTFDVHCNSFFPMFVLLYVVHYFLSPLLITHGFIPLLLSNLLFMVGASYYHYLNFLGYDVLPFLERTTFFLYPIGIVIVLSPILILSGFNPSRYFMNMYFSQRL